MRELIPTDEQGRPFRGGLEGRLSFIPRYLDTNNIDGNTLKLKLRVSAIE